jgi:hypothetical protein
MDRGDEVGHETNVPRRMAWRVMIEKNTSTRLSQLPTWA